VKASQPDDWTDLTVVALEQSDALHPKHARTQRVVGALAAAALLAGAVALPAALHTRSRSADSHVTGPLTGPSTCSRPVDTGYRSTVIMRIAERPPVPASAPATTPATRPVKLSEGEPVQLAFATCEAALVQSHLRSGDGISFDATTNATGDLLSLTVVTPSSSGTTTLARNWAATFRRARIADAKAQIRQQQHQLSVRVAELHHELRRVDDRLVKLMPTVYGGVLRFDAPGGGPPDRAAGGPPPVPEQGTPAALNLAFERIQILSSLTNAGENAASLRITVVKPDVFATVVSQSPAVLIKAPHHATNTSTVLVAIALLAGGVLLAASAFWLGRRNAMRERAGAAI
jgi:hypothetical protein